MISYERFASALVSIGLRGKYTSKLLRGIALIAESSMDQMIESVRCSVPTLAPDCALTTIGEPYHIMRSPDEPADLFASRLALKEPWVDMFGTIEGLKTAFAALGMTDVSIASKPTWNDQQYAIVVRQPHPFGWSWEWGEYGLTWGDGQADWGGNYDEYYIEIIKSICAHHRGAHAIPMELIVVVSGDIDANLEATTGSKVARFLISYLVDRG